FVYLRPESCFCSVALVISIILNSSPSLRCVCPQAHKMVHEWGGIARQIVWSRDICGRPAAPRIIGAAMVNPALSCCGQSRFVCWPNWCTATFLQQVHRKVI